MLSQARPVNEDGSSADTDKQGTINVGDNIVINNIKWLSMIIFSGLVLGIFIPFPLILVPVCVAGLTTFAITSKKLTRQVGFLGGLGSIYVSVFAVFIKSIINSGQNLMPRARG